MARWRGGKEKVERRDGEREVVSVKFVNVW